MKTANTSYFKGNIIHYYNRDNDCIILSKVTLFVL